MKGSAGRPKRAFEENIQKDLPEIRELVTPGSEWHLMGPLLSR